MITYRRLTEKELDTFIRMRISQLREEGAREDIDLVAALYDYYSRHMADGNFGIEAALLAPFALHNVSAG